MSKFKKIMVWIKNLLTPITIKASISFLESKGYKIEKKPHDCVEHLQEIDFEKGTTKCLSCGELKGSKNV